MADKDDLGRAGEGAAGAYLVARGYRLLARNWRVPGGEIDIVARTGDILVFVEVKTRGSARFGDPLEAVDARKRARLWRLAHAWCAQHRDMARGCELRLDVVGIVGTDPSRAQLEHIEGVPWA